MFHFKSISDYPNKSDLQISSSLEKELRKVLNGYDKKNLQFNLFSAHIDRAITNSQESDENPNDRWPNTIGTRVYKILLGIIEFNSSISV